MTQAGVNNTNSGAYDGCVQKRSVLQIIMHPNYDSNTLDNDMALLQLSTPVSYRPIDRLEDPALPLATPGTLVTVAGWGTIYSGGPSSGVALHVKVPVVDQVKHANLWVLIDSCSMPCHPWIK